MSQRAVSIAAPSTLAVAWSARQAVAALLLRLVLFIAAQALIVLLLATTGEQEPWGRSAHWWQLTAVMGNVATVLVLARFFHVRATAWRGILSPRRISGRTDAKMLGSVLLAAIPLAAVPNYALAYLFLGSPQQALEMLVQPVPVIVAAVALIMFPLSTALVELPVYYGIIQPRLAALTGSRWVIIGLPALMHSIQHLGLPLLLDAGFLAWRALMFLPFALLLSWALHKRVSLMPYLVLAHLLINLQMSLTLLTVST